MTENYNIRLVVTLLFEEGLRCVGILRPRNIASLNVS